MILCKKLVTPDDRLHLLLLSFVFCFCLFFVDCLSFLLVCRCCLFVSVVVVVIVELGE